MGGMKNHRLELLTAIAQQILGMTGAVDAKRVAYCTAGKFSDADIKASLAMLHAGGLVDYRAGKYHAEQAVAA